MLQDRYKSEWRKWRSMVRRCETPEYVERGIRVCEEWRDSFEQFMADMGPMPEGAQLRRYDICESFTPENCRWISTYNLALERGGAQVATTVLGTMPLVELAEVVGIDPLYLVNRYNRGDRGGDLIRPLVKRLRQIEGAASQRADEIRQEQDYVMLLPGENPNTDIGDLEYYVPYRRDRVGHMLQLEEDCDCYDNWLGEVPKWTVDHS